MVKLNVLGISYSQTQSGAYALILTEENGERRIPIIVGGFEAQSIAIELEGLKPPRPLTHDLFVSFSKTYGISIKEILIYKLEEGVFFSQLLCDDGEQKISLDARTSDAIALALRFKCPIYTTEEIINKAGIVLDFDKEGEKPGSSEENDFDDETSTESSYSEEYKSLNIAELKEMLSEAVANEDYEKAALIKNELDKRTNK
ncbi:MAG: bifunctional nuclease family protein [Bacteroidales bacterium]|nr:bifunctional nuclease family protein [Bacteroidales bacterium]MCF8390900.1 bifunctional nuclease family protein [Bacteroidales bacterium]